MTTDEKFLVTVILHHDQSKNLEQIMDYLRETGFYRDFPPEGSELVSWVVAMSHGFIIHLRVAPDGLRSLNRFMEQRRRLTIITTALQLLCKNEKHPIESLNCSSEPIMMVPRFDTLLRSKRI